MDIGKMLLRRIQQYDFALYELQLYLDTHPDCKNGLAMFAKYKNLRQEAISEYNEKFGPITSEQSCNNEHWSWIGDPWPWERS